MVRFLYALVFFGALVTTAEARSRHPTAALAQGCNVLWPCELPYASTTKVVRETRGKYIARHVGFGGPKHSSQRTVPKVTPVTVNQPAVRIVQREVPTQIIAHPAGCPTRAFCGCGAAVRVFGHSVRELWLAANWFKFPRTSPAPGMVAVRRHHVMVLEADLGGGVWQVYDANSGRHATRIHARSIAGYTIVSPRA